MKYYIVIGHKKGEAIEGQYDKHHSCDWIEMIERDDEYSENCYPPGAHKLFGFMDVNFKESAQYGALATKTQEAWLIGRHRIARMLDFGNFGYQFVRRDDTKRIQFPDKISLSFDKQIKDNGVNKPLNDSKRVDIELTELNEQIINCYDKECDINSVVFKLAKFDNYGDAYIDLQKDENYQDFKLHIDHFVHFMKNYPNSNIYLQCKKEIRNLYSYSNVITQETEIKNLLKNIIKDEHLTNYFEFCDDNFERRRPGYDYKQSGTPFSEYDSFSETIDQFFNENTFNKNPNGERNFYNIPFKKAKITINNNWSVHANSEKFIKFLQYNPAITLEIDGNVNAQDVMQFALTHSIKTNIIISNAPDNNDIKEIIAFNRKNELQNLIKQHGYDNLNPVVVEEKENEDYRLTLEKYLPQKLNLVNAQNQNADLQVGQNQNQNQNQNQSQQLRQSNNEPYEPTKLEINNKISIPDVKFSPQDKLLKSLIGLPFQSDANAPQTETNIDHLFAVMEKIIEDSPASKDCYCPLSYSVEELIPGAFYVPKEKLSSISYPKYGENKLNDKKNTLFFSPPYASIAIKKDKYAFKPYHRPADTIALDPSLTLVHQIFDNQLAKELINEYQEPQQKQKITLLLNNLYSKRGLAGIELLTKSLHALKTKNPTIYQSLIKHYLITSNDFSEYIDNPRFITCLDALAKLKDQQKVDWWTKILEIQCRSNPNFELNHLFTQFTAFWEDMDKLQRFMPVPAQFPFEDFADAGITLGKMFRIMIKARNRFEQIKSFEGGNISHAYMLFDLFNSSMYCKEMDDYCATLTSQLKAEDAFDKSKLKETYFSTQKLAELTDSQDITLAQLKSYLFAFAAVNGNTNQHNNSDIAFYKALFNTIEEVIADKYYSVSDKKKLYSTIMLFAAYGNNATKERMALDIKAFVNQTDPITTCQNIWNIYNNQNVSKFFSAQDEKGKMVNSDTIPSLHTISTLIQKTATHQQIINKCTNMIVENKKLSPALQKIMKENPDCIMGISNQFDYLTSVANDEEELIKSLFLITAALNKNYNNSCTQYDFYTFRGALTRLDKSNLNYLNQLFLDIDFSRFPKNATLFNGKELANDFCLQASRAQNLDDLIFTLQDHNVHLTSIKPSEQGLLIRIKQLEHDLSSQEKKNLYVTNYQDLIIKRLRNILGTTQPVELFYSQFIKLIAPSDSVESIKMSHESLMQIVETTKKDDLVKIMSLLQQFPIGNALENVGPSQLLNVTSLLLKHILPIENVIHFLETIKQNPAPNTNAKLLYLQSIFAEITQEASCYENNDKKKKLSKETTNQIKACMELMKTVDTVHAMLFSNLFIKSGTSFFTTTYLKIPQYLQFIEVLASSTNISNPWLKHNFTEINKKLGDLLQQYPHNFSDLLDIVKFDAELLTNIPFRDRSELSLVAKICKNEFLLNSRKNEEPTKDYKQQFTQNLKLLLQKNLSLDAFYSNAQLAQPSAEILLQLLDHYNDNASKALHHFEKDPWFKRPHSKVDIFGKNPVANKELAYQTDFYNMSKQNDVLDKITSKDTGFKKSARKNLLFSFSTYINELGYSLPAFQPEKGGDWNKVPVRKLSDVKLKEAFVEVKYDIARLRDRNQNNIWQSKKYQRAVCKLLAIIREALDRDGNKNAYSTQMDAILLAILAGDYKYAMQINTGEGKAIIAIAIAVAMQTLTDKQLVITTSNLSLAARDSAVYNKFTQWFDITHETISATTKDKHKLHAKIIHTTGNDFALCHGKDVVINNSNKIYLNDEFDYTLSHLMPAINSQSRPNEEENWWIYEEILAYVAAMDEKEAKRKPELQTQGLIKKLDSHFNEKIKEIQKELVLKLQPIEQNADNKTPEEQMAAKEAVEKDCYERIDFYARRIAKLNEQKTEDQFNILIDSAVIAQFVLKRGDGYEVIDHFEEGKALKKLVPTECGKPITEGDVMYMYGIHQFLIQKTIMEFKEAGDNNEFMKPSELESTTYFNNYSIQAGGKSIGITGTIPKEKYKMYEALIGSGKSDVIPPHQESQRIDAVPFDSFKDIKIGNEHVCQTEEQLIKQLAHQIKNHDGPALIYCSNKNVCESRHDALIKQLNAEGYTVQIIIPGVTEDFTDGDKLTTLGRQAQNKKTVTLTVGDGRGIDINPKGQNGLLTMCSFVPENAEKVLQIYGRSGRNGKPGKTNLFILESELTKYGIKFNNLDEEFNLLDTIRNKEFDFAIKKIGFMQYEIQKQIHDEKAKTTMINYMDDLYNRLLLRAVADKVKNHERNVIGNHTISGRWEPFVMLNDEELENIYQEFYKSNKDKLQDMQLYSVDINGIKNLQGQYNQEVSQAVERENAAQKGMDRTAIKNKIEDYASQQKNKLYWTYKAAGKLADGTKFDLDDTELRKNYNQFSLNISLYDKSAAMMQKYIGTHLGIYGFINENTCVPYEKIYKILEQQKRIMGIYKDTETNNFYKYLIYNECLQAVNSLLEDINSNKKQNQESVEQLLQKTEHYIHMAKTIVSIDYLALSNIRNKVLRYYEDQSFSHWDTNYFNDLQNTLKDAMLDAEKTLVEGEEDAIRRSQYLYQELQDKIYTEGADALGQLADKPLKENDSKLTVLFSMLQMATKQEKESEPVQRKLREVSAQVSPTVDEYNEQVKQFKAIINKQRSCYEFLNRPHNTKYKISQYKKIVSFDKVTSKNLVEFYHQYNKAPETLLSLKQDINREQLQLEGLEKEVEQIKLERSDEARRKLLAEEAERKRQEEHERRMQYVAATREKISSALNTLKWKILEIDHPLEEARTVAKTLFTNLERVQYNYLSDLADWAHYSCNLRELDFETTNFKNHPVVLELNQGYVKACEELINDVNTRRILERDLHWGPFLNNLLKALVNIVISVLTVGFVNNFFTPATSETIRIIDEEKKGLNPD